MITRDAAITVTRIPLELLAVYEHQHRYPRKVLEYTTLLDNPAHQDDDPGFIIVKPRDGRYEILDGHHRYCALILTGRPDALAIIIQEREEAPRCSEPTREHA